MGDKKILGEGLFNVPQNKIDQLIKHKIFLTKSQKEQIINALQTRGSLFIQLTPQQRGGFLGTLLASVGVPLLLNAISGRGLQLEGYRRNEKKKRKRSSIREEAKEGERTSNREEAEERKGFDPWEEQSVQWDPNHWGYPMNKPLSNFDLVDLPDKMNIKNFRGVFAKDTMPDEQYKNEVGIVNLIGPGTHWVEYRIINGKEKDEYFDSFGLPPPIQIEEYLEKNHKMKISLDELQDRDSIMCGLCRLYFLFERQNGVKWNDVLHPSIIGKEFIKRFFMNIGT